MDNDNNNTFTDTSNEKQSEIVETVTVKEIVSQKKEILFSIGDDHDANATVPNSSNSNNNEPHQLFTEMDQLQFNEREQIPEWKESARWVKFEEDVERGGRWSKPHVATLSLHSIFELRSCIYNGCVFLDMNVNDLDQIADLVLDYFIETNELDENYRQQIKNILLAKHLHQHEKEFRKNIDNGEIKQFPLIKSLADMGKKMSHRDVKELDGSKNVLNKSHMSASNFPSKKIRYAATTPSNMAQSTNYLSPSMASGSSLKDNNGAIFELGHAQNIETPAMNMSASRTLKQDFLTQIGSTASVTSNNRVTEHKANQHFMKKIPQDAEASNVLVGEVDFLEKQLTAFIRLKKSVLLGDLTEVPVPTRFIFVILGPSGNLTRYREIGRSIATLMSDDIFHDVAYKARNRQDLLNGIDEFLDQVTVLPPGEWHPNIRLDPPVKVLEKEERLELKAQETAKNNGHLANGKKNPKKYESSHADDPALQFTGRFCGGLIDDIKRKAPHYLSDFKDGLSFQCISTILFLYFACLSPIITFGGLLGVATDKNMAAIESLVSGAVCGILYHLFAGQPMTILGSTGPVLVFETIVKKFCDEYNVDYLGFRCCIGLWIAIFLLIMVATDLSYLVKYITRFTEESFAVLIAFIFIRESFSKLFEINRQYRFTNHYQNYYYIVHEDPCYECVRKVQFFDTTELPFTLEPFGNVLNTTVSNVLNNTKISNSTGKPFYANFTREDCIALGGDFEHINKCKYVPDVFLFSVSLFMFTFFCAMGLKQIKFTRFFPLIIRNKISDFAVVITVAVSVSIDYFVGLNTPKLEVPSKFQTTRPDRGWFINPLSRNSDKLWLIPAAILPALLGTILIFMDQQITAVIVNRKENKLKKGCGYHLDLLIVALCIAINSLLGIPWFVAATVLSMNHVLNLKVESQTAAPGEKPKFLGIVENRVTGLLVFVLIGGSVFMTKLLGFIPMPVLYAIFLYMGINPLKEIQFIHRLLIIFMPEKYQPAYNFLKHVRTFKVHLFTFIQLGCLILLFFIKMNKAISIAFPIMVLALVFIRKLLDYIFSQKELSYLDDVMPPFRNKKDHDSEKLEDHNNNNNNNNEDGDDGRSDSTNKRSGVDLDKMNISNELLKTSIWKDINDSHQLLNEPKKRTQIKTNRKINDNEELDIPLIDQYNPNNENLKKNIKS